MDAQTHENEILGQILRDIEMDLGVFCEFGAWDGIFLSNCKELAAQGWGGVFIEADLKRFMELVQNYRQNARITCVNAFVKREGPDSLTAIIERSGCKSIDVLSIDINSDDLGIWMSSTSLRPSVVIIEYNPTMPFDTEYVNPLGKIHGSSALSIFNFAQAIGYKLVKGSSTNLFFLREDLLVKHELNSIDLSEVSSQNPGQIRLAFGYDGTLIWVVDGLADTPEVFTVPWSRFRSVQPIPRTLRQLGKAPLVQLIYSSFFAFLRRPYSMPLLIKKRRRN
jgi:hypothetical protein